MTQKRWVRFVPGGMALFGVQRAFFFFFNLFFQPMNLAFFYGTKFDFKQILQTL